MDSSLLVSFAAIAVVVGAAALARFGAARIGQSMVVAEILVGIVLGPSLFGAADPAGYHWLFTHGTLDMLRTLSQVGLVLFMFQIGLDLDLAHLRYGRRTAVLTVALAGIIVSFGIGFLLAALSAQALAPSSYRLGYECFFGTALSITALPVLSKILLELGLERHPLGVFGIAAAALSDVAGWTLLAATTAIALAEFSTRATLAQIGMTIALVVGAWFVIRPLLRAVVRRALGAGGTLSSSVVAFVFVAVFIFAMATIGIGIFAGIGGLLAGMLLCEERAFARAWRGKFDDFLSVFFLPMYFTFTGLRTNLGGLDSVSLWLWCGAILLAATAGKLGVTYAVARLMRIERRDASALAFMMNTRGLVELIVLNIGLDLHMIPQTVFTMLVVMAVVSTAITPPALRRLLASVQRAEAARLRTTPVAEVA